MVLTHDEALLLNHNYIGTEHLLLGLIREGDGIAANALTGLGISLQAVRAHIEEIIGRGMSAPTGHIPFTPRTKKVMDLSLREAVRLLLAEGTPASHRERGMPGVPSDLDRYDQQLAKVRWAMDAAIEAQDFDTAAALRVAEKHLLDKRAQRERALAAGADIDAVVEENRRLHQQVERLQDLLRQPGIEPDGGTSQTA